MNLKIDRTTRSAEESDTHLIAAGAFRPNVLMCEEFFQMQPVQTDHLFGGLRFWFPTKFEYKRILG